MLVALRAFPSLDRQEMAGVHPVLSRCCADACPAAGHAVPGPLCYKNNRVFFSVHAIVHLSCAFNNTCAGVRQEPLS